MCLFCSSVNHYCLLEIKIAQTPVTSRRELLTWMASLRERGVAATIWNLGTECIFLLRWYYSVNEASS